MSNVMESSRVLYGQSKSFCQTWGIRLVLNFYSVLTPFLWGGMHQMLWEGSRPLQA